MKPAVIKKVLYVPELGTNLFSILAATRLGWEVIFSGTTVRISSAKHEVIMVGERAGRGLYLLKIHTRFIHEDHDKQLSFTPPIPNASHAQRQRTKHIDITYNFILLKQEDREIDIQFVNSEHQWADFLTKPLLSPRLTAIREPVGIVPGLTLCDLLVVFMFV
jgi:hypothetical protein